ncbi:hypothetical protein JK2ML_0659 [Mycobacterium leprae Kyoto-2]|uniref:Uncharacterized protein n=3 Tax=Mycobacterium leprae TaxID=1769 RepID=Q7AQH0_MYCLE|nr:hypothetical protein A8144_00295 [Mycobacterium leprae 3125609]OAX72229.1 hypothetical protein A3216_00355 [Mycobacterium leprae 7935681]CAB11013.1 hypothetical protein MLCB1779.32 [Mycobacterium leprae]CAR70753.1 hypothetical protein MLBr00659 [Mycobacterium leprae Br4923]BBC16697.1 hypothetical protein JK2ML_0659 [Mycobacterium leprae Kyoto-2]
MVDTEVHNTQQHRESLNAIVWWLEKPGAGKLDGAKNDAGKRKKTLSTKHSIPGRWPSAFGQFYPLVVRKDEDLLRRAVVRTSPTAFIFKRRKLLSLSLTTEVACGRHE